MYNNQTKLQYNLCNHNSRTYEINLWPRFFGAFLGRARDGSVQAIYFKERQSIQYTIINHAISHSILFFSNLGLENGWGTSSFKPRRLTCFQGKADIRNDYVKKRVTQKYEPDGICCYYRYIVYFIYGCYSMSNFKFS